MGEAISPALYRRTSKLSFDDVRQIRSLYARHEGSHRELAKRYNVSATTIRRVITRWSYDDVA